jgi:ParB-like nuclease family protein
MSVAKVMTLNIDQLETNVVQPPKRTTTRALSQMRQSLEVNGLLRPIMVGHYADECGTDHYVVLDGHRTVAAWESLGNASIQCAVSELSDNTDSQIKFTGVNACNKRMAGKDFLYQWTVSHDRERQLAVVGNYANNIKKFIKIFGVRPAELYGRRGDVDPSIVNVIRKVRQAFVSLDEFNEITESKIGHWLIRYRAQVDARWICDKGSATDIRRLGRAISVNRPLPPVQRKIQRKGARYAKSA